MQALYITLLESEVNCHSKAVSSQCWFNDAGPSVNQRFVYVIICVEHGSWTQIMEHALYSVKVNVHVAHVNMIKHFMAGFER